MLCLIDVLGLRFPSHCWVSTDRMKTRWTLLSHSKTSPIYCKTEYMYKRIISWNDPFPINILDFLTPLPALGEIWWYWRAFVSEFRPNHNHSIDITARGLLAVLIMGYRPWSDENRRTEILVRFFDFLYIHVDWFFVL